MKVAFLGDIALIGKYDSSKHDFEEIKKRLRFVKAVLDECDYVVGNLESPFTKIEKTKEAKTLPLRTNVSNVKILQYLGVDAVSLANNHFFDYGDIGAKECIECLDEASIDWFGINNKNYSFEKDGIKVIVGGYCCHTTNAWHFDDCSSSGNRLNTLSLDAIEKFISESDKVDGLSIVYAHWGEENTHFPRKEHLELVDFLIKKYKTMFVGHHPHVLQGIKESEKGKAFFSLGNFCFDDCTSSTKSNVSVKQTLENLKGGIVIFDIDKEKNISHRFITFRDTEKEIILDNSILDEVNSYSAELEKDQDWIIYEARRKNEQKIAFDSRLGKRDIKWLVGHLNATAVRSVLQRQKNSTLFRKMSDKLHEQYSIRGKKCHILTDKVILYIGNFDRPDKTAAGKRVFGNAKVFEKLGYTVIMIGKEKMFEEKIQYSDNILFYSFPQFPLYKSKAYVQWLENFMNDLNIRPQMIIRYGSPSLALFDKELVSLGQKRGIPIVTDVVDWLSADGGSFLFNMIKTIDTFIEKAIFNKQCDGAIVISSYLKKYYRKYGEKCVIVPPLVSLCTVNETKNKPIKVVYAGSPFRKGIKVKNVHKIKDRLDLCVDYISKLPQDIEVKFDIFGLTENEYLTAFPEQKDKISFERISFNGLKPMKEVQEEISCADFTILLREHSKATMAGFPTKVVESMSLGTPVITTNTSDLEKYVVDGVNGFFVDINKPEVLLKKMTSIFSMSVEEIGKLKENCSKKPKFLYDNYLMCMEAFVDRIIK